MLSSSPSKVVSMKRDWLSMVVIHFKSVSLINLLRNQLSVEKENHHPSYFCTSVSPPQDVTKYGGIALCSCLQMLPVGLS